LEQFEDARGVVRVEVAGGLVGQEEGGAVNQGAGNGGPLHFAAAHLVGEGVGPGGQTDEVEHFRGAVAGLAGFLTAEQEGQFGVLDGRHGRKEIEKLEDNAEAFAAVSGEGGIVGPVESEAVHVDFAGGRLVESAEQVEQGAFAAPAGSGHGNEFGGGDLQSEIAQGVHFAGGRGINAGDMAEVDHRQDEISRAARRAQDNFRVVAEGADWMVVDKPAGLLTHPTRPDGTPTLWDGLRELLAYELANRGQVSIVTRLDRETSGLVLLATTRPGARRLGLAMQHGEIGKEYYAVVRGWPEWDERTIDASIIRQGEVRESAVWLQRCVDPRGASAVTEVVVERRFERAGGRFALVRAAPRTGRTHQIRVHLAHAGFPLVGDKIYGGRAEAYLEFIATGWTDKLAKELLLPRHALHACALEFPGAERVERVRTGLPADLAAFIGRESPHLRAAGVVLE
jgi:23S rRNA pseudouridine1911/1915/1917 synthase